MIFKIENTPYEVEVLLDDLSDIALYNGKTQVARFTSADGLVSFIADQMGHCDRCMKDKHWTWMINDHVCSECWADEVDEVYEKLKGA